MTTDSMTLRDLIEKYGEKEPLIEFLANAERRLRELGESIEIRLGDGFCQQDPWVAARVEAATQGDIEAARDCLCFTGLALKNAGSIDPTLREYMGDALISAAQERRGRTEERAKAVAKSLGLIGSKRGPSRPRFKSFVRDLQLACLVRLLCEESGDKSVKEKHLKQVAAITGYSVSTARSAYRRFQDEVNKPENQDTVLSRGRSARSLCRRSR